MIIKSLTLQNFQLFKDQIINFGQLNILQGINHDSENDSGNGSGKSTILSAIQFLLYGEVPGINLKDLISFGHESARVEGVIEHKGETLKIIREIPTNLRVFWSSIELQGNTTAIKQKWINDELSDSNYFRTYRTIDSSKGINLLDQGTTTLRKTLMSFVDTEFSKIRTSLLAKKLERETYNISRRPYSHYLSEKRKKLLEVTIRNFRDEKSDLQKQIQKLNSCISSCQGSINSNNYIIKNNKEVEASTKQKICPTCKTILGVTEIAAIRAKSETEITRLQNEIVQHQKKHEEAKAEWDFTNNCIVEIDRKLNKSDRCLMRLNEAFRFSNYKYTSSDVALYTESIKTLDGFSGYYINQWLDSLSFIINDLLRPLNIEVIFSPDKEFIKVKDNGQELKYEQCSSGQKTFLGAIFKLGILLHRGDTSGIVLIDEGFGSLDEINLGKFIDILKSLSFQSFLIYQNAPIDFQDVNYLTVERKNGESKING